MNTSRDSSLLLKNLPQLKALREQRAKRKIDGYAIKGGAVCHIHGGSAPQVRNAARMRILEMVNPALAQLKKLLTSKHHPTSLGAIRDALDRAGLKPTIN